MDRVSSGFTRRGPATLLESNRPWEGGTVTLLLIILIIVIAAAGGIIGTLLEVAAWLLIGLIIVGALLGAGIWRLISGGRRTRT